MTLADFLRTRIAEDEEVARTAEQGGWKLWGMSVMADSAGASNLEDALPVARAHTPSTATGLRTFNATHIARHDPARVLAECEAKRRLVELHPFERSWLGCDVCMPCREIAPCPTLRVLALPYADHPDYREEWA